MIEDFTFRERMIRMQLHLRGDQELDYWYAL